MNLTKGQLLLIGGGVLLVGLVVVVFVFFLRPDVANTKGELLIWGVFDSELAIRDTIIADFQKKNKTIRVTYVQKDFRTYEEDLINALAAGTGPDVFFFRNTWLPKHNDKLLPMDPKVYPVQKLQADFPAVVTQDFARNDRVYAMPLYVDTLALFYNKTIFDNAGIPLPPTNWTDFAAVAKNLRRFDQTGRITRAGAAIGSSSRSINEATDLLNLIMLQGGAKMVSPDGSRADFSFDAVDAVKFYTDFANPRSPQYSWSPNLHYSLDAFAEEGVAMIFNYAYQTAALKAKNPFLKFAVASMPQRTGSTRNINYANYFGLAVSNKTKQPEVAWNFIFNAALDPAVNGQYLNAANRPPALRSLIEPNINDPDLGVFVRQSLTATSWPQPDAAGVDAAFSKMLDLVNSGQLPLETALRQAEEEVSTLIRRNRSL